MASQAILVGIAVGVFFAGLGVGYAVFQSSPSSVTLTRQQMMSQMMSDPQLMNEWMNQMMVDPQAMQKMHDTMMNNPEHMQQMHQMMMNDPTHAKHDGPNDDGSGNSKPNASNDATRPTTHATNDANDEHDWHDGTKHDESRNGTRHDEPRDDGLWHDDESNDDGNTNHKTG